jgi:hypothetical protein
VVFLILLLQHPLSPSAAPLGFIGSWRSFESGGDIEDTNSFIESYNLDFGKDLSDGMHLSTAFRYNNIQYQDGNDSTLLNPSGSFDLRNDLFDLNLSATESRYTNAESPDLASKSWSVNWFSLLERWPHLRINYGQSYIEDDRNPRSRNSESSFLGTTIDYDWKFIKFFYDFRNQINDDLARDITCESDRHFANLQFSRDFFHGRFLVNASQQGSYFTSETKRNLAISEEFFAPFNSQEAFSGGDDTPLDGSLSINAALIDGNRETSAGVEIAQATVAQNLGLRVNLQPVSQFRVYLDRKISLSTQGILAWRIYESSNGLSWELLPQLPVVEYELEFDRTVVIIDMPTVKEARIIKLVISGGGLSPQPVFVTELEAGAIRIADSERITDTSKSFNPQTRFGLLYRPAVNFSIGYNMTYAQNLPDPGLDDTQLNQSISGTYSLNRYFSTALNVSENRDKIEFEKEKLHRSYSVSINSEPLRTLDMSMGFTHSDFFDGGRKESDIDALDNYFSMFIYPDLTAGLSTNWTHSQNIDTGIDAIAYGWRVNTTARVSYKLSLDAFYEWANTDVNCGEGKDSDDSITSNLFGFGLNYRPSDILLVYSSINRDVQADSTIFLGNIAWRCTPKIQINGTYSADISGGDTQSYDTSFFWTISRHFSFRNSYGYQIDGELKSWNLFTGLNVTF